MKISAKIISVTAALSMLLTACGSSSQSDDTSASADTSAAAQTAADTSESTAAEGTVLNFIPPQTGEKIAVITVKDFGEIKIKLFPDAAPAAVENFIGLAEMNYYDELIFHRVIPDFMIQGGDPKGNGTGGSSIWGGSFDGGIPEGLYHFSGAVAYANSSGPETNGSQFYIVDTEDGDYSGDISSYPENVQQLYKEKGGTPFLDGGYTVFGQVFEGMDVVRAIAQVPTSQEESTQDKPLTQVLIESIRIVEYED